MFRYQTNQCSIQQQLLSSLDSLLLSCAAFVRNRQTLRELKPQLHNQSFLMLYHIKTMKKQMFELFQFSQALGVLKFVNHQEIRQFNLAFNSYTSTQDEFECLGNYEKVWHKLFFNLAKDHQFITDLFEPLKQNDQMVKHLLQIYQKSLKTGKKDGIAFSRCDYFNNLNGDPKLTEYNLFSVGMQSHQEQFQEAKKHTDFDHRHRYPESGTIRSFASAIEVFTTQKKLKGIVVFVIMKNDPNLLDQKRLEMEIMKKNIKVKRATLEELHYNLKKDEKNDIYYQNELVSIVYYRVGYRFEHFNINGDPELGWKVKEEIELSNAYCIPPVSMELINEKRMQVELAKPEVLRKFVSEEDAVELEKVFVKFWDFDSLSEKEYQNLINEIKIKPEAYILKPNLEGGSNNYFGKEALDKLEGLTRQQAKAFILMEKIESKSIMNAIMDGKDYKDVNCIYQLSRYGQFCWIDGELIHNVASGFLIRSKPETQNEGGIMTGIGSIVPWKFSDE